MDEELRQAYRDVARGAGVTSVGMVLEYLLAFVVQVIAATYLSLSDFGGIVTGTAIINVGMLVGSLGLATGVARFLPRTADREERLAYAHSAFAVAVPLSALVGAAVALNAGFIAGEVLGDPAVTDSVFVFGLAIPAAAMLRLGLGGVRGQGISRYRVYVQNLLQPLSRFALVVVATLWGLGQAGFAVAYALPYVLSCGAALWLLRLSLDGFHVLGRPDRGKVEELVRYSTPQSVASIAWFLVRSVDVFLIVAILGSDVVGVYGVAYGLARVLLLFSTAFNFLGMPVSSALDSGEDRSRLLRINETIVRWLVVASVPAVFPFLVYPADLLRFIYRPAYAAGGAALAVLAVGFVAHNVLSPASSMLRATGRTRLHMTNNVVAAALNLGLNLYLIPRYQLVGAAVATAIAYLAADLLGLFELRAIEGFQPVSRHTLVPAALGVPVLYAGARVAASVPVDILVVLGLTAAVGLAYLVVFVLVVGFLPEEVMVAEEAQDRFGVRVPGLNAVLERFSSQ